MVAVKVSPERMTGMDTPFMKTDIFSSAVSDTAEPVTMMVTLPSFAIGEMDASSVRRGLSVERECRRSEVFSAECEELRLDCSKWSACRAGVLLTFA